MAVLQAEDGQPLPFWKARRLIRNIVWLAGALVVAYLLLLNLQKSRELEKAVKAKEAVKVEQVADLSQLLQLVERAEVAAEKAGRTPAITMEQAVEALKRTFPPEVVEKAILQAARHEPPLPTITTTKPAASPSTTTTRAAPTTTTTARAAPTSTATTTSSTTTTTTRPCLVRILGISLGCQ